MRDFGIWLYVVTQAKIRKMAENVDDFIHDEEGDTNFLSIIVILGIALALAAVFIAFKDEILEWFHKNADGFLDTSGTDSKNTFDGG